MGMKTAKKRDNKTCLLCTIEGHESNQPVSACHIVSRKTLFWAVLDEVDKIKGTIFSNEAVRALKEKIKKSELHSNPNFIVTLCLEHDRGLQSALNGSMKRQRDGNKVENSPLFDVQDVRQVVLTLSDGIKNDSSADGKVTPLNAIANAFKQAKQSS
jgi:hypothetical protein